MDFDAGREPLASAGIHPLMLPVRVTSLVIILRVIQWGENTRTERRVEPQRVRPGSTGPMALNILNPKLAAESGVLQHDETTPRQALQ